MSASVAFAVASSLLKQEVAEPQCFVLSAVFSILEAPKI
jgi:hypothetical protein